MRLSSSSHKIPFSTDDSKNQKKTRDLGWVGWKEVQCHQLRQQKQYAWYHRNAAATAAAADIAAGISSSYVGRTRWRHDIAGQTKKPWI
jgi:hypothetical protein